MNEPDYDAMIRSALLWINRDVRAGLSVTGLAEWLLQLAVDRDALNEGVVVQLKRLGETPADHPGSAQGLVPVHALPERSVP